MANVRENAREEVDESGMGPANPSVRSVRRTKVSPRVALRYQAEHARPWTKSRSKVAWQRLCRRWPPSKHSEAGPFSLNPCVALSLSGESPQDSRDHRSQPHFGLCLIGVLDILVAFHQPGRFALPFLLRHGSGRERNPSPDSRRLAPSAGSAHTLPGLAAVVSLACI